MRTLLATIVIILGTVLEMSAQHLQAFDLNGNNGTFPAGGLIVDSAGNLYGTALDGGPAGFGTIFQITQSNGAPTLTVLHNFVGGDDGAGPIGSLVFDNAGNLYGATIVGGGSANCMFGCGTIYELSPPIQPGDPWAETVLYTFSGTSDGGNPQAGLAIDQGGNLYGTALGGNPSCNSGKTGCGVVFELLPPSEAGQPWTENILYSFSGPDGGSPLAPVVLDAAGSLYGTTEYGGLYNQGTVFQLSPGGNGTWTENLLHSFSDPYGEYPEACVSLAPNGALLGTTFDGGRDGEGTLFQLRPPSSPDGEWKFLLLYSFLGNGGAQPKGNLTLQGANTLYGTTTGGTRSGVGAIYRINYLGGKLTETVLYSFTGGKDGANPLAGLTLYNGNLYGTAANGGYQANGTIFKLAP